ncbi:PilZ domain-containing protein [Hydrogenimonas sp.]
MNHELFLKRFQLFRTHAVGGDEEPFAWCRALSGQCETRSFAEFADSDASPAPHLLLIDYGSLPGEEAARKKVAERLKKRAFWQALLFYPKEMAKEAKEFALRHHFYGAYPMPSDETEGVRALAAVLPALLERLQEQTRTAQLQKIVDTGPPQVLLGGGRQALFLNPAARELFGAADSKAFEAGALAKLETNGLPEGEGSALILYDEKRLLAQCRGEGRERLCTFLVLDPELNVERKSFLSRVEIIDRLKDRMAQRLDPEEPLVVMLVQLTNFKSVVSNFGWLTAHTVSKEFAEALEKHFATIDAQGLWSCDMLVALFLKEPVEKLKEKLKRFIAELQIMEFSDNVTLSADFVLVDVQSDDLGGIVNLVSKAYEENLSVTDTRGFTLHCTGTSRETPDEEHLLRQFMTNIMANQLPVKLLNIYKGLPISTPTKVLKMDEEKVVVMAENIQKFVMGIEKSVVVQSPHLPGDVEAEVHFTDPERPLAILKNLRMLHTSINNRKHTRVTVTSRLPIMLKVGKSQYTGYVVDLSINSIAVSFKTDRFKENELKDKKVTVSFRLPWDNEEGSVTIEVGATVLFNRNERDFHKVVVILEPDDVSESHIFDYIYKRQKELIKEIKSKIG